MTKMTDIDVHGVQYRLPLDSATDEPKLPGRWIVHMTPAAGAAIKAQADALRIVSGDKLGCALKSIVKGEDWFPVGYQLGAYIRGAMSVVDSTFDPLALTRRPIHKCFQFDGEDDGSYCLNKGAKRRFVRFRRSEKDLNRLVG